MIRDSTLAWATIVLVVVLAFIMMPTYERFKDASGKEVDVSPNAPPTPDWLKPMATKGDASIPPVPPVYSSLPPPPVSTPLPPPSAKAPVTVSVDKPSSTESTIPSGVRTLPSQNIPMNSDPMMQSMGANTGLDKKVLNYTIPAPSFDASGPSGLSQGEDKYVLKSSLLPCSCGGSGAGSRVPGGNDGMVPSAGGMQPSDGIRKPFSAAFTSENEPQGYLNSFSAFMK